MTKNFFFVCLLWKKFAFVYDNCAFISLNEYEFVWPSKGSRIIDVHKYLAFLKSPTPLTYLQNPWHTNNHHMEIKNSFLLSFNEENGSRKINEMSDVRIVLIIWLVNLMLLMDELM